MTKGYLKMPTRKPPKDAYIPLEAFSFVTEIEVGPKFLLSSIADKKQCALAFMVDSQNA